MSRDWNKNPYHSRAYKARKEAGLSTEESKALFLAMLDVHRGNVSATAKAINLSNSTVYLWRKNDPEFAADMDRARLETKEVRLDNAEEAIDDLITTRDGATARWFLDRQGRDRGYGQEIKQRHGGINGPVIPVDIQGDYPPVPATLEEWEKQQAKARERRAERMAQDTAS